MKQIKVNAQCIGCGLCVVNCPYMQENDEGTAEYISGNIIPDNAIEPVKKIVSDCPVGALELIETGYSTQGGAQGIMQIIASLQKECDAFKIDPATKSNVIFDARRSSIPWETSDKAFTYYNSLSAAKSAARAEFDRLYYSEHAHLPLLKRIFVDYKINTLKPYYSYLDDATSVYYSYNQNIRDMLANVYAELKIIMGEQFNIPKEWVNFSVYPDKRNLYVRQLSEFEELSTSSGVIDDLKSMGKYTSLDWYVDRMDFESLEENVGENLFGNSVRKKRYYFTNFYSGVSEFIDDLRTSLNNVSGKIEEIAVDKINAINADVERRIKEKLTRRIKHLEKCCGIKSTHTSKDSYAAKTLGPERIIPILDLANRIK